jgi:hypothetical protein
MRVCPKIICRIRTLKVALRQEGKIADQERTFGFSSGWASASRSASARLAVSAQQRHHRSNSTRATSISCPHRHAGRSVQPGSNKRSNSDIFPIPLLNDRPRNAHAVLKFKQFIGLAAHACIGRSPSRGRYWRLDLDEQVVAQYPLR